MSHSFSALLDSILETHAKNALLVAGHQMVPQHAAYVPLDNLRMTTCRVTTAPPMNIRQTLKVAAKSAAKAKFQEGGRAHACHVHQDTMRTMAGTSAGYALSGNTLVLSLKAVRTVVRPITPRILRNLVRSVLPVNTLHQRHRNVYLVVQDG